MKRSGLFVLLLVMAVSACKLLPGKKEGAGAVARVHDKYLYIDELKGLVPAGTNSNDSISITNNYINNWIRQELLLHQAESNLSDEQMDFGKQVEQYRNSLIIFQYESELVRQKLDTTVSQKEIEEYYQKNQANFLLHENIIQAVYVSVSKNSPLIPRLRQLIRSEREADADKLTELCQQYAAQYELDNQVWTSFSDFTRKVPLAVADQQEFLEKNPYFEVQDSVFKYLVRIDGYKIKESVSPLSFEAANIRTILLNKRKSEMLSKMEEDLYKDGQSSKNIEIFKQKPNR